MLVFALPDELRVERRVAGIEHLRRLRLVVGDEVAEFLGRDVFPGVLVPDGVEFREPGVGSFFLRAMIDLNQKKNCPQMTQRDADEKRRSIAEIPVAEPEVQQEANSKTGRFQVVQKLGLMDRAQLR